MGDRIEKICASKGVDVKYCFQDTLIVKLVVSKTLTFCCNHSGCQMLLRT